MADVPYSPVPRVTGGGGPVGGYQQSGAPAAAFGAMPGTQRAAVSLERAAQTLADEGAREQGMINETLATDAETGFLGTVTTTLGNYQKMEGLQAASELPKVRETIEKERQKYIDSLPNDAVKRSFTLLSQKHAMNALSDAQRHATGQVKAADLASALASQSVAISRSGAVDVATDPKRFQDTLGDIDFATQRMMRNRGWGPAMVEQPDGRLDFTQDENGQKARAIYASIRDEAVGQAWENRFKTLGDRNIIDSYKVYTASKDQIPGATQAKLESWFEPKILAYRAQEEGDKWLRGGSPGVAAPKMTEVGAPVAPEAIAPRIADVIFSQESGSNLNAPTSVNGAVGGMQILPSTFQQYAQPGERIDNPQDNLTVGRRIIDDLTKRYNGDPARVAVAYFSGPGNVAPAGSETPWLRDVADGNGKTVSSYVGDIVKKMGGQEGAPSTAKMDHAGLLTRISQTYQNDPKLGAAVRSYVKTQYELQNTLANEQKRLSDQARSAFTSTFEIELNRGQKTYFDIEKAWLAGQLSDEKRTQFTLQLDRKMEEQNKVTEAIGTVQAAMNGGRLMDPKSEGDRKAVDLHYDMTRQAWKDLPPEEVLPRAVQYAAQVGMAPTPLKQMIRGGLRSGNGQNAVTASNTVRQLRNMNPQILNDFSDEDLRLATMIGTQTDYGVPPDQAYLNAIEAMKVGEPERKARQQAYDLQRGSDTKQREAADKKWLEGKLNSVWTNDPTLDPIMQSEWDAIVRSEYERTGNLDASRQFALDTVNKNWGRTEVGGDFRYMKYAPEKFYGVPTLSPAENAKWMNEQMARDISSGAFTDPQNPLTPDRITLSVDPTRIAPDGRPVYQVLVKGANGVLYAVTGKDGRPLPWRPDWETSDAKKRQEADYGRRINLLRERRAGNIQALPEGVIR